MRSRSVLGASLLAALTTVLVSAAAVGPAGARPVLGEEITIRQPDGTRVTLRVWGDEFYAVGETADGYTVARDSETGTFSYARLSPDGRSLVSTGIPLGESPPPGLAKHIRIDSDAARAQALAVRADFERRAHEGPLAPRRRDGRGPTTGAVQGIVLLIDFSDDPGTIPSGNVDDYCNLPGYTGYGNNGSVRDYFYDVSDGALEYTNYVPAAYYRAIHPKSYYTDPDVPYGQRARELIVEALTDMDNNGFDFSAYDADGDGVVDALNCFYAGDIWNSWAEGLWPHSWTVDFCADGVCTYRYQISNMGDALTLGTFCHENGHMLMGWPDLYDYGYESFGVGVFCLMAYGAYAQNPVEPCAYLKLDAGWARVRTPTDPEAGLSVPADTNVVYKFDHPSLANEFYLIENRQRVGRDSDLPDQGLAIWHVDTEGDNSNQQQTPELHYLVTLVQADGRWDLENDANSGDATDLYAAPDYTACTPETYPNTDWWDGSESGLAFTNIGPSGMTMTFDYQDAPPPRPLGVAAIAGELSVALAWDPVEVADLDHYRVERDTTPAFGPGSVPMDTPDTSLVDGPLEPGIEYFYRVTAVDLAGQVSDPSDTVSAVPTEDVQPSTPTGLVALGGGNVVDLRWEPNPEVDLVGYHVVRDTTPAFAAPETLGFPSAAQYIDATPPAGRAYWYRISAQDQTGHVSAPTAPVAGMAVPGVAFYVDASNDGAQNGSYELPYREIQSAIDASSPGDLVVVLPGAYDDAVQINDGVPLIGMCGPNTTTIGAAITAIGIGRDTVFKGFRVDGLGSVSTGLDCFDCDLVVEDCEFANATSAGVSCHNGGRPVLRRNGFYGNQSGITCSDSTAPFVVSSTFEMNSFAHITSFGEPGPTVGGSPIAANDFLDASLFVIFNAGSSTLGAEWNYWGELCVDPAWFSGPVDYVPWTDEAHCLELTECWASVQGGDVPLAAYAGPGSPNPFSWASTISFGLPEPGGCVSLRIYDVSGRLVRVLFEGSLPPGHHQAEWDGRDDSGVGVAGGVYFYRLTSPDLCAEGKLVRLR